LEKQKEEILEQIKLLLIPKDPYEGKNIIMEIRAGVGGDEAALFAKDLYRMYFGYADRKGWKVEILDSHETDLGGFKEIIFSISGRDVYKHLKYESGVHRVQGYLKLRHQAEFILPLQLLPFCPKQRM